MLENDIGEIVVSTAIELHRALGACPSNGHRSEGESTASYFSRSFSVHSLSYGPKRIVEKSRCGSAAVDDHYSDRLLGPGLLESVYEVLLAHELRKQGLHAARQVSVPIEYGGHKFEEGFRADILIEGKVIVELKCVERLNNAHRKQLLTYLRLMDIKLGYLLNFSAELMTNGIVRTVNGLSESAPPCAAD